MLNLSISLNGRLLFRNILLCCLNLAVVTAANAAVNFAVLPVPVYHGVLLLAVMGIAARWHTRGRGLENGLGVLLSLLAFYVVGRMLTPLLPADWMMRLLPLAFVTLWFMMEIAGFVLYAVLHLGKRFGKRMEKIV